MKTAKTYYSKIDVDFIELPSNLIKRGELNLYQVERAFVGKCIAFTNRKEFKDYYDLSFLVSKTKIGSFPKKKEAAELLDQVIEIAEKEDMEKMFRLAFSNVDLKFKNLKSSQLHRFIEKTNRKLRVMVNKLRGQERQQNS